MHDPADVGYGTASWHDNLIYGVEFHPGDPDRGDWKSDLALDIDHIVEWACDPRRTRFRVAPATLVFHGVTDLRIAIDWGSSDFSVAPHLPSIDQVLREPIGVQKVYLDRPYYSWAIELNAPAGGSITFGAFGLSQTLRREPVLMDQQFLGRAGRADPRGVDPTEERNSG